MAYNPVDIHFCFLNIMCIHDPVTRIVCTQRIDWFSFLYPLKMKLNNQKIDMNYQIYVYNCNQAHSEQFHVFVHLNATLPVPKQFQVEATQKFNRSRCLCFGNLNYFRATHNRNAICL